MKINVRILNANVDISSIVICINFSLDAYYLGFEEEEAAAASAAAAPDGRDLMGENSNNDESDVCFFVHSRHVAYLTFHKSLTFPQ